ncbi:MAG: hypothetical protein QXU74_01800 [Candidatus Aenigmatarchaeota archaeon]
MAIKGKVIAVGIALLIIFCLVVFVILPWVGIRIPENIYPFVLPIILLASIPLIISGFLPYEWGKILRELTYFTLFFLIIILEITILKTAFAEYQPPQVTLEKCTTIFGSKEKPTEAWDSIAVWACITLGYYPKDYSSLGWNIFFIFYILLPFIFIWVFLYGLMKGLGIKDWLGNMDWVPLLLSFIIAMFASRQIFGFFLLDFYGYGAWGLAGIFGAILFTKGVQKMMEGWYGVEEMAEETRKAIQTEIDLDKEVAKEVRMRLDQIKNIPDMPARRKALHFLITDSQSPVSRFSDPIKAAVKMKIFNSLANPDDNAIENIKKSLPS